MGLRTADIEKPIIIQIDGETHACLTIHKIFTKGLGLPHTLRLNMLMYGKEASNRKQEIGRQHYTIPNQRPKDKHCGKI